MDLNMKVLVVDDFVEMRRVIKESLKKMGFKYIMEAKDGEVALNILKKDKTGLILADWNMPKMNGLELLKAVRQDESLKDIPFIMVAAAGQKGNIMEAVKAGVTNYIVKPFTPQTLNEKIDMVFQK